ncbi:MAG: type II secretion system protein [Planctomycetota bacterium]
MSFDLVARLSRAKQARRGLTLIELIVVLVILVGLGGLLVPTITNALTRTHVSTCAVTFPEVHQMMQRVQLEFAGFGTNFDSGIIAGGDPVNNSAANTLGGGGGSGALLAANLTAGEASALVAVGITSVVDHVPTNAGYDVTFAIGGDAGPTVRSIAANTNLITLTDAQAQAIFLPNATNGTGTVAPTTGQKYVWFGIGRNWSLLRQLAPEPPTHFGDAPGALADQVHSRFGIIMQVTDSTGTALERAIFRGVSYCIDGDVFETGDNHVANYYLEVNPRGT